MIRDGVIQQIFNQAESFTNPVDGVQHPATCWSCWEDEDWETMCPGVAFLPVVSERPTKDGFKYEPLHFRNWKVNEDRVEVVFDELELSPEEKAEIEQKTIALRSASVQAFLDRTAKERGYENITTCITYADEPAVPKFQAEGQAARAWRSLVWAKCYELLAEIKAGKRKPLTDAELIAALPKIEWPE